MKFHQSAIAVCARISTNEPALDLQNRALQKIGDERIFTDANRGTKTDWPRLENALCFARSHYMLIVWRHDGPGRSLKHLIETIEQLRQRGVGFKSITEGTDTTMSCGKLIVHVFGTLAEFERDLR